MAIRTRLAVVMVVCLGLLLPGFSARADEPQSLGFETEAIGPADAGASWMVTTPGWIAERSAAAKHSGEFGVVFRSDKGVGGTGVLMRLLNAEPFRNRRIAYSAMVRVEGDGRVQPWIRVDRSNGDVGAFDNMNDRPLGAGDWRRATIEVDVAADAKSLALGFLTFGGVTAFIDGVSVEVVGDAVEPQPPSPPAPLEGQALENVRAAAKLLGYLRFFHPSDQIRGVTDWGRAAIAVIEAAEPATSADDLARRLQGAIRDVAPTVQIWATAGAAPDAPDFSDTATAVLSWKHTGAGLIAPKGNGVYRSQLDRTELVGATSFRDATVEVALDGGVTARVPVLVYADTKGTLPHGLTPELFAPKTTLPTLSATNRSTRLAAVALAWGVFQHFYPYFPDVLANWDQELTEALQAAATDATEEEFLETLQVLVAALHDGHGSVHGPGVRRKGLPISLAWAGDRLVVVGTCGDADGAIGLGDRIVSFDGRSSYELFQRASNRISHATDGWARAVSPALIARDVDGDGPVTIVLRKATNETEYSVQLAPTMTCVAADARPSRPANGAELAPGVVYFDLNGAENPALQAALPKLLGAKALIFDMRGYPGSAAYEVLERLLPSRGTSARWMIPIVTRPDRVDVAWQESAWQMSPREPKLPTNVVFLTDGRAISYAESIMGIVEAYKLGEIVGETTAGTNGNVNPFEVPGGYRIAWTGMKVLKHDGTPHHGVGIAPTVKVWPTPEGIAEGRDEVLEKGIEVAVSKAGAAK